jgi:hypothetical protein
MTFITSKHDASGRWFELFTIYALAIQLPFTNGFSELIPQIYIQKCIFDKIEHLYFSILNLPFLTTPKVG